MATENQIAANRENAKLSHGPVTDIGKAAVRLNALKHGLRARQIVLPGESQEDYDQLCHELESEWQPQTPTERMCLEDMAANRWKLIRAEKQEVLIRNLPPDHPGTKQLDNLLRFQFRFERAFQRALHELQKLRKNRQTAAGKAPGKAPEKPAKAAPPSPRTPEQMKDPHPPIPPQYSATQKDNFGRPAISIPGQLWNSERRHYQMVYDPHSKYSESLRPKFYPDPEPPAKEVNAEGMTDPQR
jgi:hypothetical protein